MAGSPSIAVKVLADLKGFTTAVSGAGTHVDGVATRMRGAFNGVTGALNQTGVLGPFQGVLDGINTSLDTLAGKAKGLGTKLMGVGTAAAGVGAGLAVFGSKDQAAQQQLQQAIEATGASYDDFGKSVEEAISHQEKFGHTANETQDALAKLTEATHDPQKALDLLGEAADLAAAKHEDLSTAAAQLGKVYNGSNKALKEFGVEAEKAGGNTKEVEAATKAAAAADDAAAKAKQKLSDVQAQLSGKTKLTVTEQQRLRDATQNVAAADGKATEAHKNLDGMQLKVVSSAQAGSDNLAALGKVLSGQASASADTFMGKLDALKAHLEDSVAQFGQKWGPAIISASIGLEALGGAVNVLTGAYNAMAISETIALAPLLAITLAVALAYIAVVLLYQKWDEVWKAIANLPWWAKILLALVVLTNPVLLLILLVTLLAVYWSDAWKVIYTVAAWAWDHVLHPVFTFIADAVVLMAKVIGTTFQIVKRFVEDWLVAPFAWAWDEIKKFVGWIIDKIDAVVGKIGSIPGASAFLQAAGAVAGSPAALANLIPGLQHGGIVTHPTLALVGEAGPEAVIPLNRLGAGRSGPVVHVENAHFNSDVDVDLFMRRVAWMARTAAV